jgi:hypothetical protein
MAFALVAAQASLPAIPDIADGRSLVLAAFSALAMVVGSQVAFVAGSLSALRALRRRRTTALPGEEVALLRRRIAVACAAGAVTAAGSALYAFNVWNFVPRWWSVLALATTGATLVPLAACAVVLARISSITVSKPGSAHGLSADLGPLARPALIGAAAVLAMLVATSVLERSLAEGALRAAFEAFAFAVCFFAFRRPLALTG